MHRDFDDYDDPDDFDDMDEDDRDASYYEHVWGGPEDEELEDWYERQEQEDEFDYAEDGYGPEDFEPFAPPLPAPRPGDEAGARQHFAALKRKYKAESFGDTSPLSPLYKMLLKLESGEQLDNNDLAWLRKNRLRGPIRAFATRAALECEKRFKTSRDGWEAVKASSFWRMAEQSAKALAVTSGLAENSGSNLKLKSAVWTTRGGAFRDQRSLDEAETCGQQAIQSGHRSFHPYMLLGAVYYQKGDPQKGDEYFATAKKLGAKPEVQDWEIKKAVSQAGEEEQRVVAQYLLQKDPVKYRWAKKYLQ